MQALREKNIYGVLPKTPGLCRDGHHLEPTYGRFAAAATWFEILLDGNILNNNFLPIFPIVDEAVSVLRQTVHEICTEAKK
ncbi:hypothetical protein SDC9_160424 [bioreactor metagenome]|uniref:DUF4886 domain-containing protein n=1 Tax=bioreactor metagenome TaxID=1076179 RepID=A0A645FL14_9ZZZZ